MKILSLLASLLLSLESMASTLVLSGQGDYRWWGIKVYQASLFVPQISEIDFLKTRPLALEILYDVNIEKSDLIATTREEWQDLKIGRSESCGNRGKWLEDLDAIWPDLNQGDRLRHYVDDKNVSQFFYNGNFIGQVDDPNFANCFLAIWLAEDSSAPKLRKRLLAIGK